MILCYYNSARSNKQSIVKELNYVRKLIKAIVSNSNSLYNNINDNVRRNKL